MANYFLKIIHWFLIVLRKILILISNRKKIIFHPKKKGNQEILMLFLGAEKENFIVLKKSLRAIMIIV